MKPDLLNAKKNRKKKKKSHCLDLAIRLICLAAVICLHGHVTTRAVGRHRARVTGTHVWAANALVGVRRLLAAEQTTLAVAVVRRATGAAARTDQPEQSAGQRERRGNEGRHINVAAQIAMDSVLFQDVVECALEYRKERDGSHGRGDGEERSNLPSWLAILLMDSPSGASTYP